MPTILTTKKKQATFCKKVVIVVQSVYTNGFTIVNYRAKTARE